MDLPTANPGMNYELFKRVQQICHIVDSGATGWFDPNPFYGQTKNGFFLRVDGYSDVLYTPWGEIRLFYKEEGKSEKFGAFCQLLIKRLGLTFVRAIRPLLCTKKTQFYIAPHGGDYTKGHEYVSMEPVSEESLKTAEGTDTWVYSDYSGCASFYALHAVDGQSLPEPNLLPRCQFTDYDAAKYSWATMMARYKAEMKST